MDSALKIAVVLGAYDKMTSVINGAVGKAQAKLEGLRKTAESISKFGDKALIGGGIATAYFGETIKAAEESEVATARLRQVFKSMGEANNKAADSSAAYASALQYQIGVEDETIMAVQAKLATYKRASDEVARNSGIYNRAVQAAFDMQADNFGDALSNINQLGKALQNPALGAQALARVGAINKEDMPLIKQIQAAKGIAAAQEYLMKAIEKQVKGVAAATTTESQRAKIAAGEVNESVGKIILPLYNKLVNKMLSVIQKVQAFVEKHQTLIKNAAKAAVALLALGAAAKGLAFSINTVTSVVGGGVKAFKWLTDSQKGLGHWIFVARYRMLQFSQFVTGKALPALMQYANFIGDGIGKAWTKFSGAVTNAFKFVGNSLMQVGKFLMANPIILIIAGIATAAFLIYKYWDKIKAFFIKLWGYVKQIFSVAWTWIKTMFLNYTPYGLVIKHWSKISAFFVRLWNGVKNFFKSAWQWIKQMFLNYTPYGLVIKQWSSITSFFSRLWQSVKNIFLDAINWFAKIGTNFFNAGKNIIMSIWNGIKSVVMKPVEAIKNMVGKIRRFLPFSPAKEGALRDIHKIRLVETIAESIRPNALVNKMKGVTQLAFNTVAKPVGASISANHGSTGGRMQIQPTFNFYLSGTATKQDAALLSKEMKKQFSLFMKDWQHQQNRLTF